LFFRFLLYKTSSNQNLTELYQNLLNFIKLNEITEVQFFLLQSNFKTLVRMMAWAAWPLGLSGPLSCWVDHRTRQHRLHFEVCATEKPVPGAKHKSAHQGKSITRKIARHQTPLVFSRWPPPAAAGPTRRPPLPPPASCRRLRRPLTVNSSSVYCKTLLSSPVGKPPPRAPMRHRGRYTTSSSTRP
jgi:hypothetical protein